MQYTPHSTLYELQLTRVWTIKELVSWTVAWVHVCLPCAVRLCLCGQFEKHVTPENIHKIDCIDQFSSNVTLLLQEFGQNPMIIHNPS